jgi:HopA1 effector protein family
VKLAPAVRADLLAAVRVARAAVAPLGRRALEELLYTAWFSRATGRPATVGGAAPAPSLAARLRAAHAATARLDAGWSARRVGPAGALLAERAGELLELSPPDYLNIDRPAVPVRVGDALAVTARRDWIDAGSAWWVTSAAAGPAPAAMARVYWNCPSQSAAALVAGITGALEAARLPYTLKCPLADELFDRTEPVVLYLGFAEWAAAKPALRAVHASLAAQLRPAVPPLTLRLGPGAAAAEDPADGRSFGQSRAAAVADGLVRAAQRQLSDDDAAIAVVAEGLAAHDISPARPYLRAGSPPDRVTAW